MSTPSETCEPALHVGRPAIFNPGGKKHGMMAAEGHHAANMPNLISRRGRSRGRGVEHQHHAGEEKAKPNSVFGPAGHRDRDPMPKGDDYKSDPPEMPRPHPPCGVNPGNSGG